VGRRFLPATEAAQHRAELLERGGKKLVERFMAELAASTCAGRDVSTVRPGASASAYENVRARNPVANAGRFRPSHVAFFALQDCDRPAVARERTSGRFW